MRHNYRDNHVGRRNVENSPLTPPHLSDGLRKPSLKSRGSSRGFLTIDQRQIVFESDGERKAIYCLAADRRTVELRDQYPRVGYTDRNGATRTHTFDFWTVSACGTRSAYAVKPEASKNRKNGSSGPSLVETLACITADDLAPYADQAIHINEAAIDDGTVYNARSILRARRLRDNREIDCAMRMIEPLRGSVRFAELLHGADHPAARRIALWNLIDEGTLCANQVGRIDEASFVHVNRRSDAQERIAA